MKSDEIFEAFMKIAYAIGVMFVVVQLYKQYSFWDATWWSLLGIAAIKGTLHVTGLIQETAIKKARRGTEELIARQKALNKQKKKSRK